MDEQPRLFVVGSQAQEPLPGEDEILAELERQAEELDRLAGQRTPGNVATESARRRVLLLDLEAYGLLDPTNADRKQTWLGRWALPVLADYRRAAQTLHRYFRSEERARRVPDAVPASLAGAPVSLDWFRLSPDEQGDSTAFSRLAAIEAAARPATLTGGEGDVMVTIDGRLQRVYWRMDDGMHASLVWASASE